jgi:PAS domain S-box-containing protein
MHSKLRVLNLEDSARDSALLRHHLERAPYELTFARVETAAAMQAALAAQTWDVILCDYSMPQFSALAALALLKELTLDIPFIVISGTIGEELAVEAMLAGANDYLMKGKLARLVPTIERELQEVENRRARRQAEAALKASEAELRALFAAMNDVILVLDAQGRYQKIAPTNPAFFYQSLDTLLGKTLHDVLPQAKADFCLAQIHLALCQGQMHKLEYSLEIEGQEVWFEGSISPLSPQSVVWVARDITERKRAEEEKARLIAQLESQRLRLSNIVANVPGFVWEAWGKPDASSQSMNYVSEYVETVLGYSVEEWLATPNFWLTIVHPDDQERVALSAAASFKRGQPNRHEFRWIAKDGHLVWVETRSVVITNEAGEPVGLRGVTIDITERKQVEETLREREEQLRHAQKMEAIGTLAGGIAHDFNNMLGIIMGYCELAQLSLPAGQVALNYLAQMFKASEQAKDLVQQILTFSRQSEHDLKPVQLQPLLAETLELLDATLPATIELRQDLDPHAPAVLADPTQIHQLMMNLGTNAWHAMQARGGILSVTLTSVLVDAELAQTNPDLHTGQYVRLIVSDTGHGMERATLERMYDPFFTTKDPGKGTGLGLAVVHGVVKIHHGAIAVASAPGQGTTFTFYFPALTGVPALPEVPANLANPGGQAHILFVDDEKPLAELSQMLLEQMGYQVTVQTSSLAALEAFRAHGDTFDLVITDQTMPCLSGVELAKTMLDERPSLPILLITGYSDALSPELVQALGIREMLMKPYTGQTLRQAIRRALTSLESEE